MVLYRADTLTVVTGGVQQVLNLGFIPDIFRMRNDTILANGTGTGITEVYWDRYLGGLSTAYTMTTALTTYATPVTVRQLSGTASAATGVVPFQTADAALYVPAQAPYNVSTGDRAYIGQSTEQVIDKTGGISQAANALVTTGDLHSFTASDVGVTVVTFHGVPGMTQINGLSGIIQSVPTTSTFTVNINTSNFSAYSSTGVTNGVNSGFFNVITGAPVNTLYSNQLLPTAEANLGIIGLVLGTLIMVNTNDVWFYEAIKQAPVTGP
jgi:hypothetical protein